MPSAFVRRPVFAVSGVALALLLSACGGSSSPAATGSAALSKSPAAAGGSTAFCAVVKSQAAALKGTGVTSLLTGGTPDAWKAYLTSTAALNQQLVDAAPADIKPTVQVLQASTLDLQSNMAAAGYDPTKMGASKLIANLSSPTRVKANADLAKYVITNCGIDLTKP